MKTLTCPSEDRLVACGGSLNNSDIRVNDNNFPSKSVVLVNAIILFFKISIQYSSEDC